MTDRQRNQYLLRKYEITLAERTRIEESQHHVCAICGKPPKKVALSVDHDHAWKRVTVWTERLQPGRWYAAASYRGRTWSATERTKSEAIRRVKRALKRASVRGLLCWTCNTGLQKWRDNAEKLAAASAYLKRFNEGTNVQVNQA